MARRKKEPKLTSYQAFLAEYGKGRCVNCGFLCKMVWNDLSHIDQIWDTERATLYNRESGHLFTVKANTIKSIPICYVGAADIDMLAIAALILGLFQLLSAFAAPVILKWLGFHAG